MKEPFLEPNVTGDIPHWIFSNEARVILAETQTLLRERLELNRILKSLRKSLSPSKASQILNLAKCRIRGRNKFQRADQMFFTRDSLEMATDEKIAFYKSNRFSGSKTIADICCGIGGDLIGLTRSSSSNCIGFDTDPIAVSFANQNLIVHDLDSVASVQSFESVNSADFDAIHIDPERRKFGKSTKGSKFSPSLDLILELIRKSNLAVKVAPATEVASVNLQGCELEWIGHSRECKQQVIWTGNLVEHPNARTATVLDGKEPARYVCSQSRIADTKTSVCEKIKRYLIEPHNVLIAAGLTDCLADELNLQRLESGNAYLTGDSLVQHKLLSNFEVLDWLPADFKKVSVAVEQFGFGDIEFKKRGVTDAVVAPFKRMKTTDQKKIGTLFFTEFRKQHIVIIAERIQ